MKIFLPVVAGLLAIAHALPLIAQTAAPCDVKGIRTDPAAAANPEYPVRTNTFNWYYGQQYSGRWWNLNNPAINEPAIWMPWEQSDNTSVTHILGKTDFPKDGWELLKRDLGYADNGAPVVGSRNPYVVLYNKRSGMLRVFVAMGELFNSYQFAEIKLRFANNGPSKKAGTLNRLEGLGTALENTVPGLNGEFVSVAPFLNQRAKWFMADFPMEYDPCACQFDSKFVIDVNLISKADVKLTAVTTGTLVTTDVSNPGATQTGSEANGAIALMKKASGAVSAGQKTYKSLNSFAAGVKGKLTTQGTKSSTVDADNKKSAVDKLTAALAKNDFLKAGLNALPYVGAAVSALDAFFGGGKEESTTAPIAMQPMTIEMSTQTTGTISAPNLYSSVTFNNPGTRAITTPEEYPYYNEALGLFSLLKKPVVEVKNTGTQSEDGLTVGRITEYHVVNELQYLINPAAGLEVQDFKVALIQEGSKYPRSPLADWTYEGIVASTGSTPNTTPGHAIRTGYVDSGCLPNQHFVLQVDDIKNQFSYFVTATSAPSVYLKFMLNLRPKNASATTQNILVVLKYPVTIRSATNIVVDETRPCLAVQPQVSAASVQAFCTSSTYAGAMNLRRGVVTRTPSEPTTSPTIANVHVYPNPTTDAATVRFSGLAAGRVSAYLTDMVGRRVLSIMHDEAIMAGEQQKEFSTAVLSAGLYQCVVETSTGSRLTSRLSVAR